MLSHKRKLRRDIIKRNVFIARAVLTTGGLSISPALFETRERVAKKRRLNVRRQMVIKLPACEWLLGLRSERSFSLSVSPLLVAAGAALSRPPHKCHAAPRAAIYATAPKVTTRHFLGQLFALFISGSPQNFTLVREYSKGFFSLVYNV